MRSANVAISPDETRLAKCDVVVLWCERYEREGLRLVSIEWNGPGALFVIPGGGFVLRFREREAHLCGYCGEAYNESTHQCADGGAAKGEK